MKSEKEIIKKQYRFVEDEEPADSSASSQQAWERRVYQNYSQHLYREYALADLSAYTTGRLGLRWRTSDEVLKGKGLHICGGLKCAAEGRLATWEVNFAYREAGQRKNALVKLRLCPECSERLNYRKRNGRLLAEPEEDGKRKAGCVAGVYERRRTEREDERERERERDGRKEREGIRSLRARSRSPST